MVLINVESTFPELLVSGQETSIPRSISPEHQNMPIITFVTFIPSIYRYPYHIYPMDQSIYLSAVDHVSIAPLFLEP
jgi:hypothetical protein